MNRRLEISLLLAILLAAAFLRLARLDAVPPGFTHDEAGHGQDALAILRGARPLYETVGYGREPLYDYLVAGAMAGLGRNDYLVLRLVSAVFGLLTVATTYAWLRRAFGPWEALLACAWLAGSFWAVSVSRQALRSGLLPVWLAGALLAWQRGAFDAETRWPANWPWFAASGILAGAALWTYMAARLTWLLFVLLPLYVLVADRACFRRRWAGMALTVAVMGLLAAPMFLWLHSHPGAEQRFVQLGQPLQQLTGGDFRSVLANSLEALGMFTWKADDLWMYNLPGRPWLGLLDGVLFYIGLALAAWRWRRPQYAAALLLLALGVAPSLVTGVSASATRAVAIMPVLYLFPALSVVGLAHALQARSGANTQVHPYPHGENSPARPYPNGTNTPVHPHPHGANTQGRPYTQWDILGGLALLAGLLAVASVVFEAARTYHDYFEVWAAARDVRVAYHTTLFETAHKLERPTLPAGSRVVLSSIYPGRYHDPYALELMLTRRDLSLRWMDGHGALVFPAGAAYVVIPAIAPLDAALSAHLSPPYASLLTARRLQADDLNPGFDVYTWDSAAALAAALEAAGRPAGWSASPTLPVEATERAYQRLALPADLGHTLALLGYEGLPDKGKLEPGDEVALVTYWRVLARPDPDLELVLFSHVLSPGGQPPVVAQQDRLDAPPWNWQVGEVFAQVHRLTLSAELAPGEYPLEIGGYTRPPPTPADPNPPTVRLTLYVDGQAAGDRILLPPLAVESMVADPGK